jgi:cobalt-zinc-cadmium efflux system membrane fusion protein
MEAEHDDHSGHDHADEDILYLSAQAIRLAGIRTARAGMGSIHRMIELPGEIGFNEDRMVHITPRYPGIAREVHGRLGAFVREGDILAVLESNESLSRYNITAPISGRIVEKHIAVGEFADEGHDMFLVADLSTVWANCEVYAKDMPYVTEGTKVRITAVEGGPSAAATLSYVAPVYDGETRSALARAVIANDGVVWRPGAFIKAELEVEMKSDRLLVERDAVQTLVAEKVLFVPAHEEGAFEPVPVATGMVGERFVEIVSGIETGTEYVAAGAFELKAKMVTANMGAHAGHGH